MALTGLPGWGGSFVACRRKEASRSMSRSSLRTWCSALVVSMLACGVLATAAPGQEAGVSAEMLGRGQALIQRLEAGDPTSVVVYGDSITAGWGTDGTHVYHRMFLDCLRYRYPNCRLDCHVSGNPGWTTADALSFFGTNVTVHDPDLLLLQFGGNDRGWGRRLASFRRDMAELLARATADTHALVIACLPPMAEEIDDGEWSLAAREVAAEAGVPAACFHRAIREAPHDFRGSFPYASHPGSFTHVVMAKEVLRAFDAATGVAPQLRCELVRGCAVSAEPSYTVTAAMTSVADLPVDWSMRMQFGPEKREWQGTIAPGETITRSEDFALPQALPAGRSFSTPVAVWVRGSGQTAFDQAWLTMAPAIAVPSQAALEGEDGPEPWQMLGADALMLGKHLWLGPEDLSGRFRTLLTGDYLRAEVQVADDDITVADVVDPSRGDSVEFYLDLRSPEHQGEPVYSEDVLALQVIPPAENGPGMQWRNMHQLPEDLADITVNAQLQERGYSVAVELPLPAIVARRGVDWGDVGFDVGINDADDGGGRKTQMMWAGTADNYLSPGYLAGLYPSPLPMGATRRALR